MNLHKPKSRKYGGWSSSSLLFRTIYEQYVVVTAVVDSHEITQKLLQIALHSIKHCCEGVSLLHCCGYCPKGVNPTPFASTALSCPICHVGYDPPRFLMPIVSVILHTFNRRLCSVQQFGALGCGSSRSEMRPH